MTAHFVIARTPIGPKPWSTTTYVSAPYKNEADQKVSLFLFA